MYMRKSSESEDRQQLSLDGQEEALNKIVKLNNLTVVGEPFRESKSARKLGRPKFNEMMELIRKGKADAILCWHLNRLARNPVDGGNIMWELGNRTIKEIRTTESIYTGTPDDRLMMSIIFGMATKKSDDIGRDVKRGNQNAIDAGKWPGTAKIGYIRDREANEIIPDPDRFNLVKKLWKLRLNGVAPMNILKVAREDLKLTTLQRKRTGGLIISQSQLYRLLHDPFYAGFMEWKGQLYPGNHKKMITFSEFQSVQEDFKEKQFSYSTPDCNRFLFQGLFKCGICSSLITTEKKINRYGSKYIYYHCSRKSKVYNFCPEKSVQEHVINTAILQFLDSISLSDDIQSFILKKTRQANSKIQEQKIIDQKKTQKRLEKNEYKLERIRDLLLKEVIAEEDYLIDKEKYILENIQIKEKMKQKGWEGSELIEPLKESFSFLNRAKFEFEHGDYNKKRLILKTVSSNLILKAKTPLISAKFPFDVLLKNEGISTEQDVWEEIRTFAKDIKRLGLI